MSDYIPPELIPNILARLPAADVLRCTSVCKSWNSIITSPSFASSHLKLSIPNQDPRLLIRYYKNGRFSANYCLYSHSDEPLELDPPVHRKWEIVDSINGLVCLYDRFWDKIVLWNPSLRKSVELPKPSVVYHEIDYRRGKYIIGFEFVPTSHEYRIIKFKSLYSGTDEAEIYHLSTGSWRYLKLEDRFNVFVKSSQARLNGILYWNGSMSSSTSRSLDIENLICSFDLESEKFGVLMAPSCLRHNSFLSVLPCTVRESLWLVDYGKRERFFSIWTMKEYGIADSWEKMFSIDTELHTLTYPLCFRDDGDLLAVRVHKTSSNKVELVSYDCNSNQVRLLGNFTSIGTFMICTHVESLVLLKVPNEVKIDQESTKILQNI